MHKCNICKEEMKPVDDINLKGFVIHGWRCGCGNEHSDPEDVDNIVRYFKALKNGVEATVYKSGNSISIRLPKVIADLYHLNANLKLPIETEPGSIRLKIVKQKAEVEA
ncbi:MAG: hypothetical protein OIN89_02155 [Candidatus Methanoperedens sp.]|jgi:hypothetical protein|nr:hypothetical protein [Candidatus Methanoperedens sp.]PKL54400.1 MAG: hypothetical protein CVV36_02115 [Candidatus Methanoperedenaceae archaeon HGW-Methanoperedenaceae-1]